MKKIIQSQSGQGLTEYLILLALVAVACIGTVQVLGTSIKKKLADAKVGINAIEVDRGQRRNGSRVSREEDSWTGRGMEMVNQAGGILDSIF